MLRKTLFILVLISIACILAFTLNILDSAESKAENAKEIADISEKSSIVTLASAMKSFRESLSDTLLADASFPLGHQESYSWSNLPPSNNYDRGGIEFSELSIDQLTLFYEVLKAFLSDEGYTKVSLVTKKSKAPLTEINPNFWKSRPYYIALFGNPETDGSWGFQLDGHHLGLNLLVHGDEVIIVPTHIGTSPTTIDGAVVLKEERVTALTLLESLDEKQREKTIQSNSRRGLKVGPGSTTDPFLNYDYSDFVGIGLKASEMNDGQKEQLRKLLKAYVYNLESEFADVWMKHIDAGLDDTYFVWIGGMTEKDSIYYRVFNPAIWIEFNDEGRSGGRPNHIHTITRSPNGNDYGIFALNRGPKTLLEHYTLVDHHKVNVSFDYFVSE
ncbi:MAG: DUF3500 domain-containing protein [Candidatus Poribacteria bacterium]|nr:DUF3500 domain-containing protein [Candidatus Poribacteria bacterium]